MNNNLLVGKNSSGKTLYLRRLLEKFPVGSVNTNLVEPEKYYNTFYNEERLDILEDIITDHAYLDSININLVCLDFEFEHGHMYSFSSQFKKIVSLICRDNSVLILDEPDRGIPHNADIYIFNDFMHRICSTYSEVWIATHSAKLISIYGMKQFTPIMNSDTLDVTIEPTSAWENRHEYFN